MPNKLGCGLNRNRSIIFVIAAVVLNLLSGSILNAQKVEKARITTQVTNWDVTIDVSSGDPTPKYIVSPDQSTFKFPCTFDHSDPPKGPFVIWVCPGDTIKWHANTSGTTSTMRNQMIVFFEDDILDKGGSPTHTFHAQDGMADGGTIDSNNTSADVPYEYVVLVSDNLTKQVFIHDPKIIIGTGTVYDVLNNAETDCNKLQHRLSSDPVAETQAKRLCAQFRKLRELLNLQ